MNMTQTYIICSLLLAFASALTSNIGSYRINYEKFVKPRASFPKFTDYVKALNYPVEIHLITTDDGYILTFFRIQAKDQETFKQDLPVVYLQHGLLDSADGWVINDEADAPGLLLANKGYDVWLGNVRGNKYSLDHVLLNSSDPEFWQFTFQNMSHYDLPAAFEYINLQTGQLIHYVGHSQGTIIMFAALSDQEPFVLKYLKNYIALAPVAWVSHVTAGPIELMAHSDLATIMVDLNINQFMPSDFFESDFGHIFCKSYPDICGNYWSRTFGADPQYDNYARYDIFMEHEPCGTSVMNMLHWKQLVLTGKYNKYDYGIEGNMLHYNQPTPPDYNVSSINTTMHLFLGEFDDLADPSDNQILLDNLTGCTVNSKVYPADHITWIWSKDVSFYWDDFLAALKSSD